MKGKEGVKIMEGKRDYSEKESKIEGIMRTYSFGRKAAERIYAMIKDTDILNSNFLDITDSDRDKGQKTM
jgi:hypothetical protein